MHREGGVAGRVAVSRDRHDAGRDLRAADAERLEDLFESVGRAEGAARARPYEQAPSTLEAVVSDLDRLGFDVYPPTAIGIRFVTSREVDHDDVQQLVRAVDQYMC